MEPLETSGASSSGHSAAIAGPGRGVVEADRGIPPQVHPRRAGRETEGQDREDDLIQGAFLRPSSAWDSSAWAGDAAFWQWLRTVALNVVRDEGRRHGPQKRAREGGAARVAGRGLVRALGSSSSSAHGESPSEAARGTSARAPEEGPWDACVPRTGR